MVDRRWTEGSTESPSADDARWYRRGYNVARPRPACNFICRDAIDGIYIRPLGENTSRKPMKRSVRIMRASVPDAIIEPRARRGDAFSFLPRRHRAGSLASTTDLSIIIYRPRSWMMVTYTAARDRISGASVFGILQASYTLATSNYKLPMPAWRVDERLQRIAWGLFGGNEHRAPFSFEYTHLRNVRFVDVGSRKSVCVTWMGFSRLE